MNIFPLKSLSIKGLQSQVLSGVQTKLQLRFQEGEERNNYLCQ